MRVIQPSTAGFSAKTRLPISFWPGTTLNGPMR